MNKNYKKINNLSVSNTLFNFINDELLEDTNQEIGQYNSKKEFKIIKAKGDLRESIACIQMIAEQLDLPFKSDTIEKILRDVIGKGKRPTLQILGGITSVMGLHSSIARIDPKMGTRIPSPTLIAWKDSFAIVKESSKNYLEIVSPSEGIIYLNSKQIVENFQHYWIYFSANTFKLWSRNVTRYND